MAKESIGRVSIAEHSGWPSECTRQVLLGCGIAYSLLYVAAHAFTSWRGADFDVLTHGIGQPGPIDTTLRSICSPFGVAQSGLLAAFGVGVWICAVRGSGLRVTAGLIMATGVLNAVHGPVHWSEDAPWTARDTMRAALAGIQAPTILIAVGSGASARSRWFFACSVATLLVLAGFGVATSLEALRAAALLPTPYLGLYQGIEAGAYIGWICSLAIALLRAPLRPSP